MKKLLYLVPATLLMLASCTGSKSVYQLAGEWNVVNLAGTRITPSQQTPFLGFNLNDGQVYGFTGCNRLTGALDAKAFVKGKPDFSKLGCTRMLCQDDQYEAAFLDALNQVKKSEVTATDMHLFDANGNEILTLKKR